MTPRRHGQAFQPGDSEWNGIVGIKQVELVGIFLAAFGLDQFDELKLVAVPDAARDVVQEFPDGQGLFVGPVLRDLQGANAGIVGSEPWQ